MREPSAIFIPDWDAIQLSLSLSSENCRFRDTSRTAAECASGAHRFGQRRSDFIDALSEAYAQMAGLGFVYSLIIFTRVCLLSVTRALVEPAGRCRWRVSYRAAAPSLRLGSLPRQIVNLSASFTCREVDRG